MADFCGQCTTEFFGDPVPDAKFLNDFDWIGKKWLKDHAGEKFPADQGFAVVCEGCGPTMVGLKGECLGDCINPSHGRSSGGDPAERDSIAFGDGGHSVRGGETSRSRQVQGAIAIAGPFQKRRVSYRVERTRSRKIGAFLVNVWAFLALLGVTIAVYLINGGRF